MVAAEIGCKFEGCDNPHNAKDLLAVHNSYGIVRVMNDTALLNFGRRCSPADNDQRIKLNTL